MERKSEKEVLARSQREALKARDIKLKYPAPKGDQLIASLKKRGLWYYDPDFPQDEEDRYGVTFMVGGHTLQPTWGSLTTHFI